MADSGLFLGALEVAVFGSVGDSVLSKPRITRISWSHAHYFVDPQRPMVIRIYSHFVGTADDNII